MFSLISVEEKGMEVVEATILEVVGTRAPERQKSKNGRIELYQNSDHPWQKPGEDWHYWRKMWLTVDEGKTFSAQSAPILRMAGSESTKHVSSFTKQKMN